MAVRQIKVSDLSGKEGGDEEFAMVVVRQHPSTQSSKTLDVLTVEVDTLKLVSDLIELEIRNADTTTRTVFVRQADFDKWCTAEQLEAARNTRGRVPGYSPRGNGNGH